MEDRSRFFVPPPQLGRKERVDCDNQEFCIVQALPFTSICLVAIAVERLGNTEKKCDHRVGLGQTCRRKDVDADVSLDNNFQGTTSCQGSVQCTYSLSFVWWCRADNGMMICGLLRASYVIPFGSTQCKVLQLLSPMSFVNYAHRPKP
jgi:hypothetical protein